MGIDKSVKTAMEKIFPKLQRGKDQSDFQNKPSCIIKKRQKNEVRTIKIIYDNSMQEFQRKER